MENIKNNLSDVQNWMQTVLIEPRKTKNTNLVHHYIAPAKVLNATESLAIYQRSYYSRLIECMRGQFKALVYTLGDELFVDFCSMYLTKHPSNSPNLGDLGKRFPDFLEQNRPDKESKQVWIDFMIAMAQFEVDLYRIFDIKGSEGDVFADLKTHDELLKLQKCVDFQEYPFDVNGYYQKVSEEENPEITKACKTFIVFLRTDYQVYVIPLGEIQFHLLKNIQKEENVQKALLKTVRTFNLNFDTFFSSWILWKKQWINKGFFLKE